jgi:AcrR family transcriptional regulator
MAGSIMVAAWDQIAADGAPALSLRAIARQLGITAPAIYNYFASRDELVTALVIEAFDSLGDSLVRAAQARSNGPVDQLQAVGQAYRRWALSHPQRYHLIFGPPLPGYSMPRQRVLPSSSRAISVLVRIVEGSRSLGILDSAGIPKSSIGDGAYFDLLRSFGLEGDQLSLTAAVLIWSTLHGLISLELSGNMLGADGEALLNYQLKMMEAQLFKETP